MTSSEQRDATTVKYLFVKTLGEGSQPPERANGGGGGCHVGGVLTSGAGVDRGEGRESRVL